MKLKPLPNTVVHVPTKEEYDELMQIYEDAGWRWVTGEKPMEEPSLKRWNTYGESTCINAWHRFQYGEVSLYDKRYPRTIITLEQFKQEQGLMKKELKDMNVGDILLLDDDGNTKKVLEVLPNAFLASMTSNHSATSGWHTYEEAERYGWRFKDQPTPKKMTLAEVSEKLGHKVEIVEGE